MTNDKTITWTVLHRSVNNSFARPFITGMVDAHSYDHAEQLFEEESPNEFILGIYKGDVSWDDAVDRYNEENAA